MESISHLQVYISADIQNLHHYSSSWISISSSFWNAMMSNSRAGTVFTVRLFLMLFRNIWNVVISTMASPVYNALSASMNIFLRSAAEGVGSAIQVTTKRWCSSGIT